MTEVDAYRAPVEPDDRGRPARASVRASIGNAKFQADAEMSPAGFLAVGAMVAMILFAVAPIVAAGRRSSR